MIMNISEGMFIDLFRQSSRKNSFCYHSLIALFEHYEEDENYEFELVCIDMEWTEFNDLEEFNNDRFGINNRDDFYKTWEEVEEDTQVIKVEWTDFISHISEKRYLVNTEY